MPEGTILQRFLEEGRAAARLACPPELIPPPGKYLLAHDPASDSPLAVPLFSAGATPEGFLVAPPLPHNWFPGQTLSLRGPLGHGFHLPAAARKVALIAVDASPALLLGLLPSVLSQKAAVALVCDKPPVDLPDEVEIQPPAALADLLGWADYAALAAPRASLPGLRERLRRADLLRVTPEAEVLVLTPMPCGGLAECGVCSVETKWGFKLACDDGPVFSLDALP